MPERDITPDSEPTDHSPAQIAFLEGFKAGHDEARRRLEQAARDLGGYGTENIDQFLEGDFRCASPEDVPHLVAAMNEKGPYGNAPEGGVERYKRLGSNIGTPIAGDPTGLKVMALAITEQDAERIVRALNQHEGAVSRVEELEAALREHRADKLDRGAPRSAEDWRLWKLVPDHAGGQSDA